MNKSSVLCACVILVIFGALLAKATSETISSQDASTQASLQQQSTQSVASVANSANNNCSLPCSTAELVYILEKISTSREHLLSLLGNKGSTKANGQQIRPKCVKQLVTTIRELASGELEMKTLLEFASSTLPINRRLDLSSLRWSYASERGIERDSSSVPSSSSCASSNHVGQVEWHLLGDDAPGGTSSGDESKSKFLNKFVANVNHWIDTLQRFTLTREWSALVKIFNGAESIMSMFASEPILSKQQNQANNNNNKSINNEDNAKYLIKLEQALPAEVQTLASSLNQLFPWHVWPWNNVDLYSTIDTFLNHGIFAFSKTTSGPERRIDFLSLMLERLFKSLKQDSFPKKCNDWSKIICDLDAFHDRLVLLPTKDDADDNVALSSFDEKTNQTTTLSKRQELLRELTSSSNNKLTQELTCIMFSSLSMQQFGAKDKVNLKQMFDSGNETLATGNQLHWDKLIRKALSLYRLSREALTDEQWRALYNQVHDAWTKTKISDRVIMLGRIVQLLTNCHMPREILESALWKDIYKYKNALNQISDIVIEELNRSSESGKFTIEQLSLGSKQLEDILTRFIRLLPRLIEAISRTIVEGLPELVNKFFNEKVAYLKGPCKGHSFADLIPSMVLYRDELIELELLVCKQLRIKPSITMAQINNLTNEFLAMVFSGNFSGSFAHNLPKFWSAPISGSIQKVGGPTSSTAHGLIVAKRDEDTNNHNGTSIIDELAQNPRLAQIVAILQSSPLDPPEVHAELPELDWVEAGTSVALLYESIQKLISFEGIFSVFPEIVNFQDELMQRAATSKQLFKRLGKRDTVHLIAYTLDTCTPIALRTFQQMDSFHNECLSTFRDIFGDVGSFEGQAHTSANVPNVTPRESRQWQCLVSSTNFASFALNNIIKTFNSMLKSIINQMGQQQTTINAKQNNIASNRCVLFDGSITTLMDNLPHIVDLALETILIASTNPDNANQHVTQTLKETLCSYENTLDPFGDQYQLSRQQKLRHAICHLLHESSLATCGEALKVNEWTSTMKELNVTWFEATATSVEPSFRGIINGVHQFLDLFGKVKPNSMSDGLIAHVLNFNSYWTNLVNKAVSSIEKYREKRFELALQVLMPIIGENLMLIKPPNNNTREYGTTGFKARRRSIQMSVMGAKSVLEYLTNVNEQKEASNSIEAQLNVLFTIADRYSIAVAETVLRTAANNIAKLEQFVKLNSSNVWLDSCSQPIETYLDFETIPDNLNGHNKATLPSQSRFIDVGAAKDAMCKFNWTKFEYELLLPVNESLLSTNMDKNTSLAHFTDRQLVRVALTKWGQVLDLVMESGSKRAQRLPKFLTLTYWKSLQEKLPTITPYKDEPTNFSWIWMALERLVLAWDSILCCNVNGTSAYDALVRTMDQLNCALDSVKGGITWDNIANIYQDRQDILAAHSTLNNGIVLAAAGANTFLAHKKFQRFLNDFIKPKVGLVAFCDMRDKSRLEAIFVAPNQKGDLYSAIESFQEFICDTNLDTLVQNINPIATCYQLQGVAQANTTMTAAAVATTTTLAPRETGALTDSIDRFFKLFSLAVLDAKLVETIDSKPPIFDKNQWDNLRMWWLNQTEVHQGNSGLALTLVRIFQTLDSINSEHVVWRAIFRSIYELSEVSAYLLRATELERNQEALVADEKRNNRKQSESDYMNTHNHTMMIGVRGWGQKCLASTLTNVMFPEANNFISFRTFKQLRYLKSISDYFATNHNAQQLVCKNLTNNSNRPILSASIYGDKSRFELIDYQLDSSDKLFSLLCHYHSSQWLTVMNVVLSKRTASLSKKTNYMTKYLSLFTKNFKDNENLQSFIHGQQLENIEAVANTTVVYLIALTKPFRTLELSKISNMSWHSLPNLLDQIDSRLCSSKFDGNPGAYQLVVYEPKKPDIETLICKLPSWNITQVYNYISENIDLQNMISLVAKNNRTAALFGMTLGENLEAQTMIAQAAAKLNVTINSNDNIKHKHKKTCITPFKFASKWLKIIQDLITDIMSKGSRDKIHKCLSANKKNQSIYSQTLRFLKMFNSVLSTLNDFTVNNSWHHIRKTWNSISYALLDQTDSSSPLSSSSSAAIDQQHSVQQAPVKAM